MFSKCAKALEHQGRVAEAVFGEPETTEIHLVDDEPSRLWRICDTRYGIAIHSFVSADELPFERMAAMAIRLAGWCEKRGAFWCGSLDFSGEGDYAGRRSALLDLCRRMLAATRSPNYDDIKQDARQPAEN